MLKIQIVDERYVYGVTCTWHGTIQEVKAISGFPSCPYCGGMLFEVSSRAVWDRLVLDFSAKSNEPLYPEWVQTQHDMGRCVPRDDYDWKMEFEKYKKRIT